MPALDDHSETPLEDADAFLVDTVALMQRAVLAVRKSVDCRLRPYGVTAAQWQALSLLRPHVPLTPGDIARALSTDASTVTRMLDRLEAKGLCLRKRRAQDRRAVDLTLTPEGAQTLRRVDELARAAIADQFARIDGRDMIGFDAVLQRLTRPSGTTSSLRREDSGAQRADLRRA